MELCLHARSTQMLFQFLEFTSLNMRTTKQFLYFYHNLTSFLRKLYSWKDGRHWVWNGNKYYVINTFRDEASNFEGSPPPLYIYVQHSSTRYPLDLGRLISNELHPPSPLLVLPSGRLSFSVSTHQSCLAFLGLLFI